MARLRLVSGLVLLLILSLVPLLYAQTSNLLQDPGFEGTYTGRGRGDFNFPEAWGGWWTDSPSNQSWMNVAPNAFPHTGGFKRSGGKSQSISRGSGTFTAAAYQIVNGIPAGTTLRATAWVFLENVSESQAQVRIGIGNNVSENPFGADIVWSGWNQAVQSWQQLSVDAVAKGGAVTVFVYTTQVWPNDPNALYIDDAELIATGTGTIPTQASSGTSGGTGGGAVVPAPTTAPPANVVPFVSAQGTRDDGSIVHVVQSGDTIASISVAYGVPVPDILALNNLSDPRLIAVGQEILVKGPDAAAEAETTSETVQDTEQVVTEEAVIEAAQAASPTSGPIELPTQTPTTENTPEPTPIPATPTDAPPAPVISNDSGQVFPAGDPADSELSVCVYLYEDNNLNRIRDTGEAPLAGGVITLRDAANQEITSHQTDDADELFCFTQLSPGQYSTVATPPEGYGLTTPARLLVQVQAGAQTNAIFGAAQGVTVAVVPTADNELESRLAAAQNAQISESVPQTNALEEFSGLIVFGAAGLILVVGLGVSALLRRR